MAPDHQPALVARSRQPLWPVIVLGLCTVLLGWMVSESLRPEAVGAQIFGPVLSPWFFGLCAAICAAGVALTLFRRLLPRAELVLDETGVTSHLFWGRGTVPWGNITHLTETEHFLFVHGQEASGRQKKLVVSINQLSVPRDAILGTVARHRPDLIPPA